MSQQCKQPWLLLLSPSLLAPWQQVWLATRVRPLASPVWLFSPSSFIWRCISCLANSPTNRKNNNPFLLLSLTASAPSFSTVWHGSYWIRVGPCGPLTCRGSLYCRSQNFLAVSSPGGNTNEISHFYYAPSADITQGGFVALFAFAAQHGHPITIHNCPDLVAFQVAYPLDVICPFLEVPPLILFWDQELLFASRPPQAPAASSAVNQGRAMALESPMTASILSIPSGVSRGADPSSVAAANQASGSSVVSLSRVSIGNPPPPFPRCPNFKGIDAPPPAMGSYHPFGWSSLSLFHRLHPPPASFRSGFLSSSLVEHWRAYNIPGPFPKTIPSVVFGNHHWPVSPPSMGMAFS